MDPHTGFVVAAYVVATVVLAGLIVWVVIDHRVQQRALTELEARGVTRRSGREA